MTPCHKDVGVIVTTQSTDKRVPVGGQWSVAQLSGGSSSACALAMTGSRGPTWAVTSCAPFSVSSQELERLAVSSSRATSAESVSSTTLAGSLGRLLAPNGP